MERTRRFWGEVAIVGFFGLFAGAFNLPVVLLGATGVAIAILGRLYVFSHTVIRIDDLLTIDHTVSQSVATVNEPIILSVDVEMPIPTPVDLSVDLNPPVTARVSDESMRMELQAGQRMAQLTVPIEWGVAGTFTFDETRITVVDPFGLFTETISRVPSMTITVDTQGKRPIYVGQGASGQSTAFTGTAAGRTRPGIEPVEVREYVPGDTLRRIDWNATARLNRPHVREFETETERSLLLVIDHRSNLSTSQVGESSFDYLRTVALGILTGAHQRQNLISLVTIGDDGITSMEPIRASKESYLAIRRQLLSIELDRVPGSSHLPSEGKQWTTARASEIAKRLENDDSPFGQVLKDFFRTPATYTGLGDNQSMFRSLRNTLGRHRTPSWVVILTDDTDREDLRRSIDFIRQRGGEVSAYIAPRVLFSADILTNLTTARSRYLEFETFRRELDNRGGVEAYEVGPVDRVEAVRQSGNPASQGLD